MSDAIEEIQRAIFERQGVSGAWGITCLGRVNKEYKGDAELLSVFYAFVSKSVPPSLSSWILQTLDVFRALSRV